MACIFCQSKFHDYRNCPVQYKLQKRQDLSIFKQSYFGKSPNVFVGKHGYPNIRVGILGAEQYSNQDDPLAWSRQGTPISEIVQLRSTLINSHFQSSIKGFRDRFAELAKDVSLAKRPVDVEINLQEKPRFRLTFNDEAMPHGPAVPLKTAAITENVPVDTRVDKAASANDLLAGEALISLAEKGIDTHFLTKAFSMGNFGIPLERKLVPTRWSITAVDDILGKQKVAEIKKFPESDCLAYFGGHLGNYYLILFFDEKWQYELFEQYVPSNHTGNIKYETDYEGYEGRKSYVVQTAGGYYAARLPILEKLEERKRQSAVMAIRIITEEYTTPLGVWVCRNSVRMALESIPLKFSSREAMIQHARILILSKFRYDISPILKQSKLLNCLRYQTKLREFS
jgi:DNA repair protein NreA